MIELLLCFGVAIATSYLKSHTTRALVLCGLCIYMLIGNVHI